MAFRLAVIEQTEVRTRAMARAWPVIAGLLLLLLGRSAAAQVQSAQGATVAAPDSAVLTDQVIDAGRKIFHGNGTCHGCHGDELQGGPIAPALRGPKWRHVDGSFASIVQRVKEGRDGTLMVSLPGGISEAEAVQAATYVYAVSQGKAKP